MIESFMKIIGEPLMCYVGYLGGNTGHLEHVCTLHNNHRLQNLNVDSILDPEALREEVMWYDMPFIAA